MTSMKNRALRHAAVWIGAVIIGVIAVLFAKLIANAQEYYFRFFIAHPFILSICAPVIFVLATYLVKRFAPEAKGSGIPQVLQAIKNTKPSDESNIS